MEFVTAEKPCLGDVTNVLLDPVFGPMG